MVELAELFQAFGAEYLSKFQDRMLPSHIKVMQSILRCRTPSLGGQVYQCPKCDKQDYSYHSCNNRHCPKCGGDKIGQWIKKQFDLLLPTPYFFVTFTLPEELRFLIRANQKFFYSVFFTTSAAALKRLALDKRFVGGQIGFLGIIQTWARNLIFHPHIHYIVPAAALSADRKRYIKIKNSRFLVHVKPLSRLFKTLFRQAIENTAFYHQIPAGVWQKEWVVHVEAAGYGREIIKYIAPYVYRVALSNHSIKKIDGRNVTFTYEDSAAKKSVSCTVDVLEFMRRFLQHTLPDGFMKVRYFGIMGANTRKEWLLLKQLLFRMLSRKNQNRFLRIDFKQKQTRKPCCRKCGTELFLIGNLPRAP